MSLIKKSEAITHSREGVFGRYYQLPEIANGTTIAYAEFTSEHGQRTIGDHARLYYIVSGEGEFMINEEKFLAEEGDLITIPPHATYNLWPKDSVVKVLLHMELLDTTKLPK